MKPKPTNETLLNIIHDIQQGSSAYKSCKEHKVSTSTFYSMVDEDIELKNKYERAKEDRGDACLDRINEYCDGLLQGKMDPKTARVLIDTEKWKACKFYPKMYGDKQEQIITGSISIMPDVKIDGQDMSFNVGESV